MSILDDLNIKRFKDCKTRKERFNCVLTWVLSVLITLSILIIIGYGILCHFSKNDKAVAYADTAFAQSYETGFFSLRSNADTVCSIVIPLYPATVSNYTRLNAYYDEAYFFRIKYLSFNNTVYNDYLGYSPHYNAYTLDGTSSTQSYLVYQTSRTADIPNNNSFYIYMRNAGSVFLYDNQLIYNNIWVHDDQSRSVVGLYNSPDVVGEGFISWASILGRYNNTDLSVSGYQDLPTTLITDRLLYCKYFKFSFSADGRPLETLSFDDQALRPVEFFIFSVVDNTRTYNEACVHYFGGTLDQNLPSFTYEDLTASIFGDSERSAYWNGYTYGFSTGEIKGGQDMYNSLTADLSSTLQAKYDEGYDTGYAIGINANFSDISPFEVLRDFMNSLFATRIFGLVTLGDLFSVFLGIIFVTTVLRIFFHG